MKSIQQYSSQSGFSLLEMLIALFVFSLGLLAVAGLQTVSKQSNFESIQRTVAAQIANGLLEDIRTNGGGIAVYVGSGDIGGGSRGAEPAPNCSTGAECNPAQKAAFDLWFWEQSLDGTRETTAGGSAGGLVLPTLCVAGPVGGAAGIYRVTVVWRGSASLASQQANACGTASGNYGAQNVLRRIVQIPTYIDPNF
jgi:type IV pilus assembly protein PilV